MFSEFCFCCLWYSTSAIDYLERLVSEMSYRPNRPNYVEWDVKTYTLIHALFV